MRCVNKFCPLFCFLAFLFVDSLSAQTTIKVSVGDDIAIPPPEDVFFSELEEYTSPSSVDPIPLDNPIQVSEPYPYLVDDSVENITQTSPVQADDLEADSDIVEFGDWLGYNSTDSDTTWLLGSGDNLGIVSLETYPTLDLGNDSALTFGSGFHFLNGPIKTDLPPRLFDFQLAYHRRKLFGDSTLIDLRFGVGAFSDFEGSARKGIRYPGHLVAYHEWHPWFISLFGVESLDRDDVSVLPVAGAVWRASERVILDLVFPRPKLQLKWDSSHAIYLSGELGGGTWAIERVGGANDNATYRDLRLMLGLMDFHEDETALEIGWAFDRSLQYRSGIGNTGLQDAFVLRFRSLY